MLNYILFNKPHDPKTKLTDNITIISAQLSSLTSLITCLMLILNLCALFQLLNILLRNIQYSSIAQKIEFFYFNTLDGPI